MTTERGFNEDLMILREKIEAQDAKIKNLAHEIEFIQGRIGWLPDLTQIPAYDELLKENNRLSKRLEAVKREVAGK